MSKSQTEAFFSSCGNYRWWLKRSLSNNPRTLLFIGLNPSYANSHENDPTLRRLLGFCHSWGYGSLLVVNLFGRINKHPSFLKQCKDPIGKFNDDHISFRAHQWSICPDWDLWLGWGVGGSLHKRDLEVLSLLKAYIEHRLILFPDLSGVLSAGLTLNGHPRHPLYLPGNSVLNPFFL